MGEVSGELDVEPPEEDDDDDAEEEEEEEELLGFLGGGLGLGL
jgi:hypothetical protein